MLKGECLAIVEEQERRLHVGDFLLTPPGTNHVLVGAGTAPCVILMVGARRADQEVHYPVSPAAAHFGASAVRATDSPPDAYAQGAPWPAPRATAQARSFSCPARLGVQRCCYTANTRPVISAAAFSVSGMAGRS